MPNITKRQFLDDCLRFRKMFGDRRNALDTLDAAFGGLFTVFANLAPGECDTDVQTTWEAMFEEWNRRKALMVMAGHKIEAEPGCPIYTGV